MQIGLHLFTDCRKWMYLKPLYAAGKCIKYAMLLIRRNEETEPDKFIQDIL